MTVPVVGVRAGRPARASIRQASAAAGKEISLGIGQPERRIDAWRGWRALEWRFPFATGWDTVRGGPHGEAVRVIGRPRGGRLNVFYVISYAEKQGHAKQALAWLHHRYPTLIAREVVNRSFGQHMADQGLFDVIRNH